MILQPVHVRGFSLSPQIKNLCRQGTEYISSGRSPNSSRSFRTLKRHRNFKVSFGIGLVKPVINGIPSGVIKHGLLENGPLKQVIFLLKPSIQFGDLPLPCLITRGYIGSSSYEHRWGKRSYGCWIVVLLSFSQGNGEKNQWHFGNLGLLMQWCLQFHFFSISL